MKHRSYWKAMGILALCCGITFILSRIRGFCDWYIDHIYPFWSDHLGRCLDRLPFVFGELLMYVAAVLVVILIIGLIIMLIRRKNSHVSKGFAIYMRTLLGIGLVVLLFYMMNWVVPFKSTYITFPETTGKGYTVEELQALRNYVIVETNAAAKSALRDEDGNLYFDENFEPGVVSAMQALGDEFPRLKGYYPKMKPAWCSDFLYWMKIGGYTYPYTMEMTCCKYELDRMYFAVLYAHESSHHQGYYQEDEASFLSYIGCIRSEHPNVRYAGWSQMYNLIEPEYQRALLESFGNNVEQATEVYLQQPLILKLVQTDLNREWLEYLNAYDQAPVHAPKQLKGTVEKAGDMGWDAQEQILKEKIYGGALGLLLQYYDGVLY